MQGAKAIRKDAVKMGAVQQGRYHQEAKMQIEALKEAYEAKEMAKHFAVIT